MVLPVQVQQTASLPTAYASQLFLQQDRLAKSNFCRWPTLPVLIPSGSDPSDYDKTQK